VRNALVRAGLTTVSALGARSRADLLAAPTIRPQRLAQIRAAVPPLWHAIYAGIFHAAPAPSLAWTLQDEWHLPGTLRMAIPLEWCGFEPRCSGAISRTRRVLERAGLTTVNHLCALTRSDLARVPGVGTATIQAVQTALTTLWPQLDQDFFPLAPPAPPPAPPRAPPAGGAGPGGPPPTPGNNP
jgi:hypothetical protein